MLTPIRAAAVGVALSAVTATALLGVPAAGATTGVDVVGGPALASTGVVVSPGAEATPLPAVVAESWVLADLTTGQVLAAKAPHRRARPASTLKTLTALTLLPQLDKDAIHTATDAEARADGGHVGIVPGGTYTMWDLWHGLLLPSGNDAAAALADANGGMAATVAEMQAMAVSLQANDTTVRNASGLDADGQLTSAYDLALIARAAMANEDFRTLTKSLRYDFPGKVVKPGAKRATYKIYTQNRLLLRNYPGTVGGKTGFTSLAHRTFWGAARRGGHTLAVTLLQIGQPTETAAKSLLTWGFANLDRVTPVGELVDPLPSGSTAVSEAPAGEDGSVPGAGAAASSSSTVPARTLPSWLWVAGSALVVAGLVLVLWGRRRRGPGRPEVPGAGPYPDHVGADPVPTSGAPATPRPAAARSSSVVVSTPGRREEVVATATDASGPPTAPVPPVTPERNPADQEPGRAADPAPAPTAPAAAPNPSTRPAPGGNVRVISPTDRSKPSA